MIPFEDLADLYFVLGCSVWRLGVLQADQVARALTARDAYERWWDDDHVQ